MTKLRKLTALLLAGALTLLLLTACSDGGGNAHAQVNGMKAGDKGVERRVQTGHNVQQLRGSVRTGSQPHRLADLGGQQRDEHIRDVGKNELFDVDLLHRSSSFRFVLSTTAA